MQKNIVFAIITLPFLFTNCSKENNYKIEKGLVGKIAKETRIKDIDSLYATDSIVKLNPIKDALGTQGEVEIYEKGGKLLLLVSPENDEDPEAYVTNIRIFDERFTTDKGLTPKSTFKELKEKYEIEAIQNAINAVVIFIKNSDLYITIDKKQLPEDLRYNFNAQIEASQIPDEATFKYFMVGWDNYEE